MKKQNVFFTKQMTAEAVAGLFKVLNIDSRVRYLQNDKRGEDYL